MLRGMQRPKDSEHDGQLEPALRLPDQRDVAHPLRIESARRKLSVEQVGRHRLLMLAVGGSGARCVRFGPQSQFSHQLGIHATDRHLSRPSTSC
jgi:hypothetical protein